MMMFHVVFFLFIVLDLSGFFKSNAIDFVPLKNVHFLFLQQCI